MSIWTLDEGREARHSTELLDSYGRLARGDASWRDMPVYAPEPPLDRDLAGFFHLPGFKNRTGLRVWPERRQCFLNREVPEVLPVPWTLLVAYKP